MADDGIKKVSITIQTVGLLLAIASTTITGVIKFTALETKHNILYEQVQENESSNKEWFLRSDNIQRENEKIHSDLTKELAEIKILLKELTKKIENTN